MIFRTVETTPRAKILNASAGSGKTYQLAFQYVLDVIRDPDLYRRILAVTFTNKATEEMKTRILKEIHNLASGEPSDYLRGRENLCRILSLDELTIRQRAVRVRSKILHDYSHFTVLTIDTFFQRILRAFIRELGIDLNYNVEIETSSVLAKGADALIEQITVNRDLQRWLSEFVQERIDEGRKWDIRDGILALAGEIFKEKNKSALSLERSREELKGIVSRAWEPVEATQREFRKTAEQAVGIISGADLSPEDFPSKSKGFAMWFYTAAEGALKPYGSRVVDATESEACWGKSGSPSRNLAPQLRPLLCRMRRLYDENSRHRNTYTLLHENYRSFALLTDLYARVQQLCKEQNLMLLSETKYLLAEFIDQNDAPFIYEKVGNRFDRFMIDEFQDTSVREWENFLPLLQNAMAQSAETSVLLVGDIKQSIYRWRGGDWRILQEEALKALGTSNTEIVPLCENWRSLPQIVAFNNHIIAQIVRIDTLRLKKVLAQAVANGSIPASDADRLGETLANAYKTHIQKPCLKKRNPGYVSIETFDTRPPVVERICALLDRGFRPCDMLILVRRAADGARIAAELLDFKRRNTDPRYRFDVMTQEALIVGNAPVTSFVTAALRLALNPADTLARALFNHYLGREFDALPGESEKEFFRAIRLLSPEEAFERIVMEFRLQDDRQQTAYLQAIHDQIITFCATKIADIELFLRWWDETGCNRSLSVGESVSTIEISTIHKAKGLEKSVVLVPYCSWQLEPMSGSIQDIVWAEAEGIGAFPVRYRKEMADSAFSKEYYHELVYAHVDSINLLYVALTRASESLHLFIPSRKANIGELLLNGIGIEGDKAFLRMPSPEKGSEPGGVASGQEPTSEDTPGTGTGNGAESVLEGHYTEDEHGKHFAFGEFTGPESADEKEKEAETGQGPATGIVRPRKRAKQLQHLVLEEYPTAQTELQLRLPSQRYFEEGETELSPRNFGILMHRAFEQADDQAQIDAAVLKMQADGTLSKADADDLKQRIARALQQPEVREWFSGKWRRVRNEQEIICPGNLSVRRPDRVMVGDGGRAVVVDYKFGKLDIESHRQQIREYMRLLREMGYAKTEGFLWYVRLGKIEPVTD